MSSSTGATTPTRASYLALFEQRLKQLRNAEAPKAPNVLRFPLPHFSDTGKDNNTDHDAPSSGSSTKTTTADSMRSENATASHHPKQLVSAIISDIRSKTATNIPPHLRDSAADLLANNEIELLQQSSDYYELLATQLLDLVFDLYDLESLAKMERDMAIEEGNKAIAHERSMAEHYDQLLLQNEVEYQEYPKPAPDQAFR